MTGPTEVYELRSMATIAAIALKSERTMLKTLYVRVGVRLACAIPISIAADSFMVPSVPRFRLPSSPLQRQGTPREIQVCQKYVRIWSYYR
jgi:hypothetical protein